MDLFSSVPKNSLILVTGAKGFVGAVLVESLLQYGFTNIRCFMRSTGNIDGFITMIGKYPQSTVDIIQGNLLVPEDCKRAVNQVKVVYHLAAGTGKSFPGCMLDSGVSTRNLLEALVGNKQLIRFVNVGSFAVYSNSKMRRGALLDETCALERDYMQRFDAYAFGKYKQDEIVIHYGKERGIPYTILRPGVVFGPGRAGSILGRCGVDTFGFFMHITGRHKIPLTYVDNCADAIIRAGFAENINGEVFNIVDDDLPRSAALIRAVKKNLAPFFSIRVPYRLFYFMCSIWEKYSLWSQRQLPPVFNRWKCDAYYKGNRYSNEKLKKLLGWKPIVSMDEALKRYFDYMKSSGKK